jgi:hypothetical protein
MSGLLVVAVYAKLIEGVSSQYLGQILLQLFIYSNRGALEND